MIEGYKLKVCVPSGRKRQMSILIDNLRRFDDILDEVMVLVNVDGDQHEDEAWLRSLPGLWPKCKVYDIPEHIPYRPRKQMRTGIFYRYMTDEDTLYVRMDDDICFVDDRYFENIVKFRLDNPAYFLVFGNIINNAVTSFLHQQEGHLDKSHGEVEQPYCMDLVGWQSPVFADYIHRTMIGHIKNGTVEELFLDTYELENRRFSISNFIFFGKDMAKFLPPENDVDEEIWLTEYIPPFHNVVNAICGNAVVSHYSFFGQRPHLDTTDILDQYRSIAKEKLSGAYYKLLEH